MRWLYYLYLRAPGSTVILVANKCDGSIDEFTETADRVEESVREQLNRWHEDRGIRGRSKGRVTDVTILPGMRRVTCLANVPPETSGLTTLQSLIFDQAATPIQVPPAWDLALGVIRALRDSHDPITAARTKLGLPNTTPTGGGDEHAFISTDELSRLWRGVVQNVKNEVQASAISNPESALQGALWIRCVCGGWSTNVGVVTRARPEWCVCGCRSIGAELPPSCLV